MGIRTPDLFHAINRQHVHRNTSAQVTVLTCAPAEQPLARGLATPQIQLLNQIRCCQVAYGMA